MKNKLKQLRSNRNLTLRELAEKININFSTLGKLERGDANFTQQHIEILAEFFGVSADYLLGLPQKAIPLSDGTFKAVRILGSVHAGTPHNAIEEHLGFLMAKVDNSDDYFYLMVNGDSMSPTFEDGDYVLVRFQKAAENNQVVVAGLNGDEATVKRYKKIGDDYFLFPDNPKYEAIKLNIEHDPYIVGVVTGFYRPQIK